MLLTCILLDRV